jgi:hypothetical protein
MIDIVRRELFTNLSHMTIYHPHCNQYKCYHDGGIHRASVAVATPIVAASLPYFYMTQYKGYKKYRKRINPKSPLSAEEQMEDFIREREMLEDWKTQRWYALAGIVILISWFYVAQTYILPVLDKVLP